MAPELSITQRRTTWPSESRKAIGSIEAVVALNWWLTPDGEVDNGDTALAGEALASLSLTLPLPLSLSAERCFSPFSFVARSRFRLRPLLLLSPLSAPALLALPALSLPAAAL